MNFSRLLTIKNAPKMNLFLSLPRFDKTFFTSLICFILRTSFDVLFFMYFLYVYQKNHHLNSISKSQKRNLSAFRSYRKKQKLT